MTSESVSSGGANRALMIVLAVIAVIALIVGILWMTGSAPSFLDHGSHVKSGAHLIRGSVGIVVALVCGAGAWLLGKRA